MNQALIGLSLLDPLYSLFGIIIRFIYQVFNNYGLAIIIFTILIRLVLLPFNVKQHKSSLQQRALSPQLQELQRYYGDDKQGYSQAQMELYKKHNISMFGGCLPMILQLVLIWPVYRIISGPLFYIMQVPEANLQEIGQLLVNSGRLAEAQINNVVQFNIPIMKALHDAPAIFAEAVSSGLMRARDLMDLGFLGLNLGETPTINPSLLFGEQMTTYLPLLIMPLLATATTVVQSWYAQKTMAPSTDKSKMTEAEKKNPALQGQNQNPADATQASMKSMRYMMPIMTLFFTFTMPAAMSLYWIIGNVLAIFQVWLFNTIYTNPMAERQAASDAEYEASILQKAKAEDARLRAQSQEDTKKKRRRKK